MQTTNSKLALKSLTSQSHVFLNCYERVLGQSSSCPSLFDRSNLNNLNNLTAQKLMSLDIQVTIERKNKNIYNYMILQDQNKGHISGRVQIARTRGPASNFKGLRGFMSKRVHESRITGCNYEAEGVDQAWTSFGMNMGVIV